MNVTSPQLSARTLSRSLLLPGPQPPLSHLGATLMRHVVGTVVRYSLYQLGLPMPEAPPIRILRLRVFLDAAPLAAVLEGEPGGGEVLAAMLHPGGAGELEPAAGRLRAAAALHRARLAALGPRRSRVAPSSGSGAQTPPESTARSTQSEGAVGAGGAAGTAPTGRSREELWSSVGTVLAGRMPYLCDAALGELVTSIARRRLRLSRRTVGLALGEVAWQVHRGREADPRALGPPDPLVPSWAEAAVVPEERRALAERARGEAKLPGRPGRRGAFREAYRWVLSEVRPLLLELGQRALEEGIVDAADDVFFIPFDLGSDLVGRHRPAWLAAAVATNRREHEVLYREPEHSDEIVGPQALARLTDRSAEWDISPLLPVE